MTEITQVKQGNRLTFQMANMPSGLYKMLIPAGTVAWDISIQTYKFDAPCTASLAFDKEPYNDQRNIYDTRKTLELLNSGLTLYAYSPENSGTIMISNTERPTKVKTTKDQWLFIDFNFPSGKALNVQSIVEVDAAAVPQPDNKEATVISLMQESGLVAGLLQLTGYTEAQLVQRALSSGTWAALLKFYDLVKK